MNQAFSSLSSKQFRHHEPVILTEQYSCEYKWKHFVCSTAQITSQCQHTTSEVKWTSTASLILNILLAPSEEYHTQTWIVTAHLCFHMREICFFDMLKHNAICILSSIFSNTPNNNDLSWIDATNVWWRVQKTGTAHCPNASSRVSSAEWEFCSRQTLHASRVRCERNIHYWRYVGNIIHKAILLSEWSTYKYDQGNATNNGTGLG